MFRDSSSYRLFTIFAILHALNMIMGLYSRWFWSWGHVKLVKYKLCFEAYFTPTYSTSVTVSICCILLHTQWKVFLTDRYFNKEALIVTFFWFQYVRRSRAFLLGENTNWNIFIIYKAVIIKQKKKVQDYCWMLRIHLSKCAFKMV